MAIRAAAREIDVQHLLGHSTSAMVRRYTRTYDSENAALAHAGFSPVAQLRLTREGRTAGDESPEAVGPTAVIHSGFRRLEA